jgi:RND family efflux transporter MFP subunit
VSSGIVETPGSESSRRPGGVSRSRLVQRLLSASSTVPQFVEDLLRTQAVVVAGTEAAGFLIERRPDADSSESMLRLVAHIRPDASTADTRAAAVAAFREIIQPCLAGAKDGAIEIQAGDNAPEPQFCLVTLLRSEGEIVAASAVITRCMDLERAQQRLTSMQLVAGYFELYMLRRSSEQAMVIAQSHQHVLQLATAVATAEGFESAAMNLCNELATRTGATRVALGWIKGQDVRVKALSHTEQFDKKQELIKVLEKVMEESVDQEEPVHYDPDGGGSQNVSRAAQELSRVQGGQTILSLPLRRRADIVGAVTLEFPSSTKLSPQAAAGLSVAVDLLAPQLYDRYQNDRWLITKAGLSIRDLSEAVMGPQHMLAKLLCVLAIGALAFVCTYKPTYHVAATFQFDSIDKRKLEAPFEGYIKDVNVRPGDSIKQGQVLLTFDTTDLQFKLVGAQAAVAESRAQYAKDSSDPTKQAEAAIDQAKIDQAQADVNFYQDQVDRGEVRAPFNGQVLTGDLTDQKNALKKAGEELFEVAPPHTLRAELTVNERDVQQLKPGQHGNLATTSLPTQKFGFTIDRIVPLGQAKEGSNVFTVYGRMDNEDPSWRPGLAGEARIDIQQKPLIWIWTHRLIEYVRLKLWI